MIVKRPSLVDIYPKMRLDEMLECSARKFPDNPFVVYPERLTYREMNEKVSRVATALKKLGVRKGDKLAIFSPNSINYEIAVFAVSRCGGIVVPVNPTLKEEELGYILRDSESKAILTVSGLLETVQKAAKGLDIEWICTLDSRVEGYRFIDDFMKEEAEEFDPGIDPEKDLVSLNYTSGTTGPPKGVMLNHVGRVINGIQGAIAYDISDRDVIMFVLPMYHIYGFGFIMTQCVFAGASQVILSSFKPAEYCELVERYQVSVMYVVPVMLAAIIKHLESEGKRYNWSSLRMVFSGAVPLASALAERFVKVVRKHCNMEFILTHGYGLTEVGPWIAGSPLYRVKDIASPGIAVYDCEFKVVDTETGDVLGPNELGEIIVRAPTMMLGYWKRDPTEGFIEIDGERYVRTGDLGYMDEEGYIYIVDRVKEVIKYKGYTVAPFEIESALMKHEAVIDAAVVGIPDEVVGEIPKAFVVLDEKSKGKVTEQDLLEWLKTRIADYKMPRYIEFVDSIPRTASGKILRRVLRDMEIEKIKKGG